MAYSYLDLLSTPDVQAAQAANGVRKMWEEEGADRPSDRFTEDEVAFIAARDSFYMATVSQSGWPYVQHRGGPPGFVKVLDDTTLAFPDFRGNRQYISLGNVAGDDRVALILVDYPSRTRLKILSHLEVRDLKADPELAARLALPGYRALPERAFVLKLVAFDWNCSQHITPRYTAADIQGATGQRGARLAALAAENKSLREQLAARPASPS
jgi:hypothetical protein